MYVEVIRLYRFFYTHPNDVGLHWIFFSKFNCDDDIVNLYDSAGSTYISSAAEMAILQTSCLALCRKSLLDTLNALYKRIQMTVVLQHCKYGQHPQWN